MSKVKDAEVKHWEYERGKDRQNPERQYCVHERGELGNVKRLDLYGFWSDNRHCKRFLHYLESSRKTANHFTESNE